MALHHPRLAAKASVQQCAARWESAAPTSPDKRYQPLLAQGGFGTSPKLGVLRGNRDSTTATGGQMAQPGVEIMGAARLRNGHSWEIRPFLGK